MTSTRCATRGALVMLLVLVTAVLGGLGLSIRPAAAAESTNYGIRPAEAADHFAMELAPGAATAQTAIVSNRSDETVTFKVYPADALTTDQGGFALRSRDEARVGVGLWAELPFDTVTISAGAQKEVPFRLTVPTAATPGDYAGGIILEAPPREGTPGEVGEQTAVQLNVVERVGVRVYLKVSGTARADLSVGPLSATDEDGALAFTLPITNTGNVNLKPVVTATVRATVGGGTDLTFRQVESLLPGQTATVRATWQDPPSLLWARVDAVVAHEGGTERAQVDVRRVPVVPAAIITAAALLALWGCVRAARTVRQARRVLRQHAPPAPASDRRPAAGTSVPVPAGAAGAGRARHRH